MTLTLTHAPLVKKKLIEAIPALDKVGLKLCRYESNILYSFIRNGVYIDVYIVNKLKGLISPFYVTIFTLYHTQKVFRYTKSISFLGETFYIPNHSTELLKILVWRKLAYTD